MNTQSSDLEISRELFKAIEQCEYVSAAGNLVDNSSYKELKLFVENLCKRDSLNQADKILQR